MKLNLHLILPIFFLFLAGSSKGKLQEETVAASSLHLFGRHLYTTLKDIELISSAAHIGFTFKGNTCSVFAYINDENGRNYLQYELDGNIKSG